VEPAKKGGTPEVAPPHPRAEAAVNTTQRYEKIRSAAVTQQGCSALTVEANLLYQRGMPGWLEALRGLGDDGMPDVHPAGLTVGGFKGAVLPVAVPVDRASITSLLGSMLVQYMGAFQ
jgi:hypothetical protein